MSQKRCLRTEPYFMTCHNFSVRLWCYSHYYPSLYDGFHGVEQKAYKRKKDDWFSHNNVSIVLLTTKEYSEEVAWGRHEIYAMMMFPKKLIILLPRPSLPLKLY